MIHFPRHLALFHFFNSVQTHKVAEPNHKLENERKKKIIILKIIILNYKKIFKKLTAEKNDNKIVKFKTGNP